MFQGESMVLTKYIFESTIRANGWTPEEYFELVQERVCIR